MLASIAFVIAAYLLGSVSFAVVTSKLFGLPDPHSYGSGNPGATNVLRTGNKAAAILTLVGDGAKGWLAVFLAQTLRPAFGAPLDGAGRRARGVRRPSVSRLPQIRRRQRASLPRPASYWRCTGRWALLAVIWLVMVVGFRISSLAALTSRALLPIGAFYFFGNRRPRGRWFRSRCCCSGGTSQHPAAAGGGRALDRALIRRALRR